MDCSKIQTENRGKFMLFGLFQSLGKVHVVLSKLCEILGMAFDNVSLQVQGVLKKFLLIT